MSSSTILNYTLLIIIIIFFITLIRIVTKDTSHLSNPSTLQTWVSILHYSCIIITILIICKIFMIGLSQIMPIYIVAYLLFLIMYMYGMYKVAGYIVW